MIPRLAYFDDPLPFALAIGGETPGVSPRGIACAGKRAGSVRHRTQDVCLPRKREFGCTARARRSAGFSTARARCAHGPGDAGKKRVRPVFERTCVGKVPNS